MNAIEWRGRWREELVGTTAQGVLVFEFTAGGPCVYFPDQARWLVVVPLWARAQWREWHDACAAWCAGQRVAMRVVADAHVNEERLSRDRE